MTTVEQYLRAADDAGRQNRQPVALQILTAALAAFPEHPEILSRLAIAAYQRGSMQEAITHFERALAVSETPVNRCNLAMALCDDGRFSAALAVIGTLSGQMPSDPMIQFTAARAFRGTGDAHRAWEAISKAVALAPEDADFRLLRAQIAVDQDRWDSALLDLDAVSVPRLSPFQHFRFCGLLMQTGQFTRAMPEYRALLARAPAYAEAWLGLAAACERANDLDGMQDALMRAQALPLASAQRAGLDQLQGKLAARRNDNAAACRFLGAAFAAEVSDPLWKSQVGFDYGQSLDKTGRYAEAWQAFNAAHATRNRINADSAGDRQALDFFALLRAPVSGIWPAEGGAADQRPDPVFVVGFPRSGTTLLEQILDARDGLVSFDEQPYLPRTLVMLQQAGIDYPSGLSALDADTRQRLRDYYFQQTEARVAERGNRRLVDKNPLNWARLPLIRALFPQARVILALRHPCDVILSCYMQNLRSTVLGGAFSDFGRIADLYIAMAEYWQALQPKLDLPVLVSRYENLVRDPETSTREIAAFLDMPWNADWLDNNTHARSKAIIHTPSYAQVLQPLNTKAMGRWRHYRPYFDPEVMARLAPAVTAMGYSLD